MYQEFVNFCPFFVVNYKECNVCCCCYHIEVLILLEVLNQFRDPCSGSHILLHCTYDCIVCIVQNWVSVMWGLVDFLV
jgi:hypothetical protein